jgi:hypothetical protein
MKPYYKGLSDGFTVAAILLIGLNFLFLNVLYEKPKPEYIEIAYEVNPEIDMDVPRLSLKDIEELL